MENKRKKCCKIVHLNSKFRNNYYNTSSTNYSYKFPNIIKGVISLKLRSIEIPNSWYTISNKFGNTKFFIIRSPLIYGPEAKGNFKSLVSLVKLNFPIPFGKLNSKRSMISIYNLIDFILHLININHLKNEILFVSDNDDLSVKSLSKLLIKNLNKSNHIFNLNLKILYYILLIIGKKDFYTKIAKPFQVDISKTLKITKWKPIYTADESIKKIFKL